MRVLLNTFTTHRRLQHQLQLKQHREFHALLTSHQHKQLHQYERSNKSFNDQKKSKSEEKFSISQQSFENTDYLKKQNATKDQKTTSVASTGVSENQEDAFISVDGDDDSEDDCDYSSSSNNCWLFFNIYNIMCMLKNHAFIAITITNKIILALTSEVSRSKT